MNAAIPAQPVRDGFKALSDTEKRWFLIRVQGLSRAPAKMNPASGRFWGT